MNIFVLDNDPCVAAQNLIDRHVNKMIVESVQMLANCYTPDHLTFAPPSQNGETRKYSYYNHPCSVWARESYGNFDWLLNHADSIISERYHRFEKGHFCEDIIKWFQNNNPSNVKQFNPITPFALAMPDDYKSDDAVESYRKYYISDKQTDKNGRWMMYYTNRDVPDWMPNELKLSILLNAK